MKDLELIGREKELKTLRDLTAAFLDERENKQALWLNVVGEDGIGKTRLLEELAAVIQSLAPSHLLTNRYSSGADFPCGSFTIALARQMEMSLWESEYTRKEKLESRFALFGRLQPGMPDILQIDKTLPVLGSLLGISYPVPVFNSQLRRGRGKLIIFSAFRRYLAALRHGRRGPDSPETVILWFDDLERMDRLSLELLVHLVQKKDTLWPLIVLTSSNCSFASKLSYLPEFNQFSLGPLSRLSRRKIIKALEAGSPGARLSSQVKQLLVEGSPGNPQLLRDAYRLLAECGPGRWEPAGSGLIGALEKKSRALETLELRDVIGQRLDRLDHRDCVILQSVALLGPYCSLEILSQMLSRLGYQFADLREKLEHLAREGFLHRESMR
ncbi:MAG: AAA family ATPase [Gemmatimonadota bacterium]|nr:AAA family ATPase [Gemmatimonadota bacterium]